MIHRFSGFSLVQARPKSAGYIVRISWGDIGHVYVLGRNRYEALPFPATRPFLAEAKRIHANRTDAGRAIVDAFEAMLAAHSAPEGN